MASGNRSGVERPLGSERLGKPTRLNGACNEVSPVVSRPGATSTAVGNKLAGWSAGFFTTLPLPTLFGYVAGVMLVSAAILVALIKPIRGLMGGVK